FRRDFFFQAEDGIRDFHVTGVQTCALPIWIRHFDITTKREMETENWLPASRPVDIVLTAGASCPDALLDDVIAKIAGWMEGSRGVDEVLEPFLLEAAD